jgi:peptidoglycan/xylan/chitin deacetylase (PgdA/CDA1 family)
MDTSLPVYPAHRAAGAGSHRSRPRGSRPTTAVACLAVTLGVLALTLAGCSLPTPTSRATWNAARVPPDDAPDSQPSAAPQVPEATGTPLPADLLARLPHFPPAPRAQPVVVPTGLVAAWLPSIPTTQPVAFLTIDDGWVKDPRAVQLLRAAHIPVTLFLSINAIRDNPAYFSQLQAAGATIEAHTVTHQNLKGKPYGVQNTEVCGSANQLATLYGTRPVLFRPPYGDKDYTTLRVVHDCGMKAAFYWKETVNGGVVRYQTGHQIQAGDIVLMHFRPTFVADFMAALQAIQAAGLTPARLEDYIS